MSVVDERPREIVLVLLQGILCRWLETVKDVGGSLSVQRLQVDNQLLTARNPIILSRTQVRKAEGSMGGWIG